MLRAFGIVYVTARTIQSSFVLLRSGQNVDVLIAVMPVQGNRSAGFIADQTGPLTGVRLMEQ
jgi:hypothetical protein